MRLVLDTSVLVASIRSAGGASRWLLRSALEGDRRVSLLLSVPLMLEYEAVLTRSEHLSASGLSAVDVGSLLDAIAGVAEPVIVAYLWRPVLPDANDDMVLEAAVNGRSDSIVTFNRRDFEAPAKRFGIDVLTPADAVLAVRK